jgi:hypothetical protein
MLKRRVQIAARVLPTGRAHSGREKHSHHPGRSTSEVGKVTFKSNGNEALSDDFL